MTEEFDIKSDRLLSKSVVDAIEDWDKPIDSDESLKNTLSYYLHNRMWKYVFIVLCLLSALFMFSMMKRLEKVA